MKIALGKEVYNIDSAPVVVRGVSYDVAELQAALKDRLPPIVWDEAGRRDAEAALARAATTGFETARVAEILKRDVAVEDWRVGEAIAEAFLVDHRACEFPWPHGRDVRNANASATGADLVGFHHGAPNGVRFGFGEVKTSEHAASPPSVMKGRNGLVGQVETLRDSDATKDHLVRYLAFRSTGATWQRSFEASASRYLKDRTDVSLFGVLVRDVPPAQTDFGSRPGALANACPKQTSIELRAKYLPAKSIPTLASSMQKPKATAP